jgi:putative SOS response-associated peptidase YedK
MCSNYLPVARRDRMRAAFGVDLDRDQDEREVFPLGTAPFIRLAAEGEEGGRPALVAEDGRFGLLPAWAAEQRFGTRTYNARSETVARLPSFRDAWARGQRCIVPVEAVFEPNWESGDCVRWRIARDDGRPLAVAGLYTQWKSPEGERRFTFTMLTVNADAHAFYRRFHRPGEEKRMPAFLDPHEYGPWLACKPLQAPRYLRMWPGPLVGEPAPLARPARPARPVPPPPAPAAPVQADLF